MEALYLFGMNNRNNKPPPKARGRVAQNVARLRVQKQLTQADLARLIGVKSANTIAAIETGETRKSKHLYDIAQALGVSITEIDPDAKIGGGPIMPIAVQELDGDLDVYGTVDCGEGMVAISNERIDVIKRPPELARVPKAYAVQTVGTSMLPIIRPGNIVIVNPNLVPRREDLCVFRYEQNGEFMGTIKEFVGETEHNWRVKRYRPTEEEITLKKAQWSECHVIVDVRKR